MESKNKDLVSRMVMAGMRVHGLSQSKSRKPRPGSVAPSQDVDTNDKDIEMDRKNDEEFKLIYHQAFKGTCFAFRLNIAIEDLQPFSEIMRDTVDQLLSIFCIDPLSSIGRTLGDKMASRAANEFVF